MILKSFLELIATFWYLIPILIFAAISRTPWFKGVLGEFTVNLTIRIFLNKKEYHLLKNITLPTPDGTTQIDHVIVSIYGVFVMETKNMHGWIFGNEYQNMWTQKIYRYTHQFQNPLRQNYKHTKTLQQLLNLEDNQLHSLIVFVGDNQFKTKMPEQVTYGRESVDYIKSKTTPVLSQTEVQQIITKIENNKFENNYKTRKQHIQHVEKIIQQKQIQHVEKNFQQKQSQQIQHVEKIIQQKQSQQIQHAEKNIQQKQSQQIQHAEKNFQQNNQPQPPPNTCPRCNHQLILRTSKYNKQFWGCSQFPKCRYTKNLSPSQPQ